MELGANPAGINEQFRDGVYRDIAHPGNRPHGGTLAEHSEVRTRVSKGSLFMLRMI